MKTETILEMKNISVEFPGVKALDGACFELRKGEVHVLIGENGAGKSTLMKVLAGINSNYTGTVLYKGSEIVCADINEQRSRGISMIFQEMNLLPNLTVSENIFMSRQPVTGSGSVDWKSMNTRARELLDSIGSDISERMLVGDLSVGQMQMVEIAKALSFEADIIIMDEPTSALTEKEVDSLFKIIDTLTGKGVAVVYISHRMEEIMKISDRITVFRDGLYIGTMEKDRTTIDEIISMMVGREMNDYYPRIPSGHGEIALQAQNICQGSVLKDLSFIARRGEITGFYGLMGAGRTELMRAVFGADKFDSGKILVNGQEKRIRSCEHAKKLGIALLTEDRKHQGLILEFGVGENISLTNLSGIMNAVGISQKLEDKNNQNLIRRMNVKTPSLHQKVKYLSGGNQQKVVISKWLNAKVDILIFDEPTRGIDVGAKVEIYKLMNDLKKNDKAVIMVSSELAECRGISDRMYIMHEGKITGCLEYEEVIKSSEEQIIKYATETNGGAKGEKKEV